MTQMTARTVASEAPAGQVRRDPAGHSSRLQGPRRSRRLITYCLQGGGQVAAADRTCMMSGRAHLGYGGDPQVPMTGHKSLLEARVIETLVRVS
jgi:hypothetical protein